MTTPTSTPALIALAGVARSGKDTAARALIDNGWERRAFADALRGVLYGTNPLLPDGQRLAELVDRVGWERAKAHDEVRRLLQRVGTEGGRNVLGEDVWIRAALRDRGTRPVVLTDCRYPNEADAVRAAGGLVFRVERPGVGPVNSHPSETAMLGYPVDAVLLNDGSARALRMRLLLAVSGRR